MEPHGPWYASQSVSRPYPCGMGRTMDGYGKRALVCPHQDRTTLRITRLPTGTWELVWREHRVRPEVLASQDRFVEEPRTVTTRSKRQFAALPELVMLTMKDGSARILRLTVQSPVNTP
jgi:hypothetical protein